MNQELIPIQDTYVKGMETQTANARDIHAALEVKKDFSDWIKQQIKRGMFEKDVDYVVVPLKGEHNGHNRIDYFFTIDSGKHIAMMSGTVRGKQVRQYFIEVEKRARAIADDPETQLANAVLLSQEIIAKQKGQIVELKRDLGIATDYKSVKAIPWLVEFFNFKLSGTWVVIGQQLAAISKEMGIKPRPIEDSKYGKVNSYHIDVIEQFFSRLDEDWSYCVKYRK